MGKMSFLLLVLASAVMATSAAPPDGATSAFYSVAASIESFTNRFYQAARSEPGNLVLSPLSAEAVLALTAVGARGQTAQEMALAMGLPSSTAEVIEGFRQVMDALAVDDENVLLRIANKLYLQLGFEVKDSFRQIATYNFRAGVEELNFKNDTENSRTTINEWVEEYTENKITDLLSQGSVKRSTMFVLVNAIYFNGIWRYEFQEENTLTLPFYVTETESVDVAMMHGTFTLSYGRIEELGATALVLPYDNEELQAEMLLLLPDLANGLENLESQLESFKISDIQLQPIEVNVVLPKFKIETMLELVETLKQLGMSGIFGPDADLSGISDKRLFVDNVVQKAYIEVNEMGTEAAAATAVIGAVVTSVSAQTAYFNADHPFLFLLRARDIPLFIGRVTNPAE